MPNEKLRRRLAYDAARLIYLRQETDFYRATLRAARKAVRGWLKPDEFPTEAEIRLQLQKLSWLTESDARFDNLRQARLAAREVMDGLREFEPRLAGAVASGDVRNVRELRLYAFTETPEQVGERLQRWGSVAREDRDVRGGTETLRRPVFVAPGEFLIRVACVPRDWSRRRLRFHSTGAAAPQLSLRQLETLIRERHSDADAESRPHPSRQGEDRFEVYRMLLAPLAGVEQRRRSHPEGDALYHSLQVFELARNELPWDEEFLLAALLHDVGKSLDPFEPVAAGLAALEGHITERTAWLIANHADAHRLLDGNLGQRARRRLQGSESYDELLLLARCDRQGRVPGGAAPEVDVALEYVREIARMCGE
ncbi:MAG: HD domain-containing protein [Planctomyces sp.]|nr:HD domain-containing protein [Planctomyces sp.]